MSGRRIAKAAGLALLASVQTLGASLPAAAAIPPTDCGLLASAESSGVLIESCVDPGFQPSDVWLDGNYMYVSRAYDPSAPSVARVVVYSISDVAHPSVVTTLDYTTSEAVGAAVGGGNGMVFVAKSCAFGPCSDANSVLTHPSCSSPAWADFPMARRNTWPVEVASQGMHSVFYDVSGGYVYGANNLISSAAYAVPAWFIGNACNPSPNIDGDELISLGGTLTSGQTQIHEVAVANNRLAVAAWTHMIVYDIGSGPALAAELARIAGAKANTSDDTCAATACNIHSAYPFGANNFWVTEERRGGRLLGFKLSAGSLVAKGASSIPSAKGASYHEIAHTSNNVHLSAYQAGLRTFRYVPDDGYYVLGAYFDTSRVDCGGACPTGVSWPGASGISSGAKTNARRLVAVANTSTGANTDRRVFLLSVFEPSDHDCSGPGCAEGIPIGCGSFPAAENRGNAIT